MARNEMKGFLPAMDEKTKKRARQMEIVHASRKSTSHVGRVRRRVMQAFAGYDRPMTTYELRDAAYFDREWRPWHCPWVRETLTRMGAKVIRRAPGRSHLWEWSATSKST
jgi:hypothetical protein